MKNDNLSKKIKELRTRQGFSQETLAYETNLGLRTIQRIENGESEPRGDTLKKISMVLKTSPDELLDWSEQEDPGFLFLLVLSPLSFLIFPLLGIITPLVLWISKRNKIKGVDSIGKKVLNFQITWSVLIFLGYLVFVLIAFGFIDKQASILTIINPFRLIAFFGVLYLINVIFILLNTFKVYKSKNVWFPSIPLLR